MMVCRLENLITTVQSNLDFILVMKSVRDWLVYTEESSFQKSIILLISFCHFRTILYFFSTEFCFLIPYSARIYFYFFPYFCGTPYSVFFVKQIDFSEIPWNSVFRHFRISAEFRFPFTSTKVREKYETETELR